MLDRISSKPMLVLLGILIFVDNFGMGFYRAGGLEPSGWLDVLYTVSFLCGVTWWIRHESRKYAVIPVYCLGLLVEVGWMIVIPYHLFKTRGVRGLIPLAALIATLLAAYISGTLLYFVLAT